MDSGLDDLLEHEDNEIYEDIVLKFNRIRGINKC